MEKMHKQKKTKTAIANLSKADLHVHTNFSDGRPSPREVIEWTEKNTDLQIVAITDHDEVKGALEAKKIAEETGSRLEIIIGEEITAKEGHIIGLFLEEKIRPGMTAKETIKAIRDQGGVAVAAHPFFQTRLRTSGAKQVDGVGGIVLIKENFDAVEVVNATPFITAKREGLRAKYLNDRLLRKSEIGGSDAHTKEGVGIAYTIFEGKTGEDLRRTIAKNHTQAVRGHWNSHGFIRYLTYVIPKAVEIGFLCLRLGFSPREPDIIKVPRGFK